MSICTLFIYQAAASQSQSALFFSINFYIMKIIKASLHLTLHTLSLRLKFPAAVFLLLQLNKLRREIVSNCELGSKPTKLQRQIHEHIDLFYNQQLNQFQQRKMNIVILIKTKNNPNKLTAGVIEIDLKSADVRQDNVKLKPMRCNDQNAYLEYSLRIQPIQSENLAEENGRMRRSNMERNRPLSMPKLVNNTLQFRNIEMRNSETRQNQLLRLLSDSHQGDSNRSRRKYFSTQKHIQTPSIDNDESKTQRISYGLNPSNQYHSRKDEQMITQLNRKYQSARKDASEAEQTVALLNNEIKQLKKKIKQLEGDLQQQETIVRNLNKKIELRDNASGDEVKQLRNKLQQTETELHELITEKNNLLNSQQSREKEILLGYKQKEKMLHEERRSIEVQLQQKDQALRQANKQLNRFKQNVGVSQAMVELLTDTIHKLEEKLQNSKNQTSKYKNELHKLNDDLTQLQKLFNTKLEASGEIKTQKKIIVDLQRYKDQAQIIIKDRDNEVARLKAEYQKIQTELKTKTSTITVLNKKLEEQNVLVEALKQKEKQLSTRVNRYQQELKNEHLNTGKIGKHVKEVEFELSKIKMEVENTVSTKAKKISDYEKVNQLLNKKMELLAQENLQLAAKYMEIIDKYKVKQDELYDLGNEVIKLKQTCMNLQVQVQTLRQDNNYLHSQTKILDVREQEISKLKEQIDYKDKLMEDIQHQHQLRQIQCNNDIKLLSIKIEQREEQIKELNEYISNMEKKQLQLHNQIQNLSYSIKNKENEVEYIKYDYQRERKNNIEFEERMNILTATQNASLTSVQQLRLENLNFKNLFRQNQHAINTLGKRYDNLFKGTIESLQKLLDILKNGKNIINQSIKHEKVQISTLLNDCIRFIAEQRKQKQEEINNLQKELSEESDKNRENLKLIKIKNQMQQEIERQISNLRKVDEIFQIKLNNKETEILEYQTQIKEKVANVRELNMLVENTKKEGKHELAKKDQIINQKNIEIEKLKEQLISQLQKWKAETLLLAKKAQTTQAELSNKSSNQQTKISQIQTALKTQKESVKLLKLKNTDLQNTIAKLVKQKQDTMAEIQKRTKDLIAVRVQSQFKSKLINQKQAEISEAKKNIEKITKEKEVLQSKRNWLQQGNKSMVINRNQLQQLLRAKNDELLEVTQKLRTFQQSQSKVSKQKEDLIKQRKQQLQNINKLNQTIKNLKDQLLNKDVQIKKLIQQNENAEKEFNKKLNIIKREKEGMQKHLKDFKVKQTEVENQSNSKYNSIAKELQCQKGKNEQKQHKIMQLNTQLEEKQTKIALLTLQLADKINSKLNVNELAEQKRKELLQLIQQLKVLKTPQKNKNFAKIASTLQHERSKQLSKYWRELTLLINQQKIKLNRLSLPNETKTVLLQDFKHLQTAYENICKCSVF